MSRMLKQYVLFGISIFVVGSAITLITRAGLGATAVTSLPFVISQIYGISFGFMTGIFNFLWVLLQLFIQKGSFPKIQFLQFGVSFLLGLSVDVSNYIFQFINPQNYVAQVSLLIIGCLLMGFGVFLQLKADAIYNPAEGIVAVLSNYIDKPFGMIKSLFDITLVILSIILGLTVTGRVTGIREGTVISAFIIGPFAGLFQKIFNRKL